MLGAVPSAGGGGVSYYTTRKYGEGGDEGWAKYEILNFDVFIDMIR